MSFILEALKRAQLERQIQNGPNFDCTFLPVTEPRRRLWPWICVVTVLTINLFFLSFLHWPKISFFSGEKEKSHSQTLTRIDVDNKSMSIQIASNQSAIPKAHEPREKMSVVPVSVSSPATPLIPESQIHNPEKKYTEKNRIKNAAFLELEPTATFYDKKKLPYESEPETAHTFSPQESTSSELFEEIPLLEDLPLKTRHKLGPLQIMAHVYHEDPSRCFVFINNNSYREGNRIGPNGPLLEKITPDSLIINYGSGRARINVSAFRPNEDK